MASTECRTSSTFGSALSSRMLSSPPQSETIVSYGSNVVAVMRAFGARLASAREKDKSPSPTKRIERVSDASSASGVAAVASGFGR